MHSALSALSSATTAMQLRELGCHCKDLESATLTVFQKGIICN